MEFRHVRKAARDQGWAIQRTRHGWMFLAPDGWLDLAVAAHGWKRWVTDMGYFSVGIETDSPRLDVDQLEALLAALEAAPEAMAVSVGTGGSLAPGAAAQVGVTASTPTGAADAAARAFSRAIEGVAGKAPVFARVDVMTEAYEDRWLNEELETYVGVAEVAGMLGVSKARVSELRRRRGFPAPIADLAAGPVWRRSSLERFLAEWDRRPGRPSSASA